MLLNTIDATTDERLTHFAIRLTLSGHVDIPRENENRLPHRRRSRLRYTTEESKGKEDQAHIGCNVLAQNTTKKQKTAKKQIAA